MEFGNTIFLICFGIETSHEGHTKKDGRASEIDQLNKVFVTGTFTGTGTR